MARVDVFDSGKALLLSTRNVTCPSLHEQRLTAGTLLTEVIGRDVHPFAIVALPVTLNEYKEV